MHINNTCIIFTYLHILNKFLYISPTSQVTPQVSHQPKANVAMRDAALHDVVTAAAAPWTVPKKVSPQGCGGRSAVFVGNGSPNHGGNHGENEENQALSFWTLGVFSN